MMKIKSTVFKRTAFVALGLFIIASSIMFAFSMTPYLASQFGISGYAAKKAIDIASGAGSIWAIIAIVGGSAGWGAAILAAAKALIKRYGKKAAAAW